MLNWTIYNDIFTTQSMRDIFSEDATIARWLEVEVALVFAKADLGIISQQTAQTISQAVSTLNIDKSVLKADTALVGRPIVGLVRQLQQHLGDELADHIHWGSTTQDIIDTALVLQMQEGLKLIDKTIIRIVLAIDRLQDRYGDAMMVGRTNGQYAQPLSFGLKLDIWRAELERRAEAIAQAARRGLVVQCGGGVGTLTAFGDQGEAFRSAVARQLELAAAKTNWQNSRGGLADIILSLGVLNAAIEQVACEINRLASDDIAEVSESQEIGMGASSAMPHKRNQRCSEFATAIARIARQRSQNIPELMQHEHERSSNGWIGEWIAVPEVFMYTAGALDWSAKMFECLEVNRAAMAANIKRSNGLVFSERITAYLAPTFGYVRAKKLVGQACAQASEQQIGLQQALMQLPEIAEYCSSSEIANFFST